MEFMKVQTRILLVAEEGLARSAYTEVLRNLDVDFDCISSPDEMNTRLTSARYNGVLVDVPTMIRCECVDKNRITHIMERFPVLRLMYNPEFGGVRGLAHGGTIKDNRDLADFIINDCIPFPARSVRVSERKDVVFNVLLMHEHDEEHLEAERTVTINVSEHGCFIYTINTWELLRPAWMIVNEFEDKTPVELKVRWRGQWGSNMSMPGIGTSFESMTAHQYAQLHTFI